MSLVLTATAGDPAANSYCTVAEADTYHEAHLYGSTWTDATAANKTAALVWATRLLDQHFTWGGSIASQDQALSWPRAATYDKDGRLQASDAVPAVIVNATAELARSLLTSDRTDTDQESGAINYVTVGQIAIKYSAGSVSSTPVIPDAVRAMVTHLGIYVTAMSGAVTLRRG